MAAALPLSEGEFNDTLRRVEEGLQSISDKTNSIVDACNRAGRWLGPLWDDVTALLDRLVDLVSRLLSEIGKFFTRPGAPLTLWHVGTAWTEQVGKRVSELSAQTAAGQTDIDERWQGPAATAYLGTLPDQYKALAAIKAAADDLDDALTKIAGGIIAFWLGILAAIVPYLVELIGWLAAASTGVGAPPAAAGAGAGASTVKSTRDHRRRHHLRDRDLQPIQRPAPKGQQQRRLPRRPMAALHHRHHRRRQPARRPHHQLASTNLMNSEDTP